jgi:hypothetical protein
LRVGWAGLDAFSLRAFFDEDSFFERPTSGAYPYV